MRKYPVITVSSVLFLYLSSTLHAQQDSSLTDRIINFPVKVFSKIDQKASGLNQRLESQSERYLSKLEKREKRLYKKLYLKDSLTAKEAFGDVEARYAEMKEKIKNPVTTFKTYPDVYSGHLDSIITAFKFVKENNLMVSPDVKRKINESLQEYGRLKERLNVSEQIKKQIQQRRKELQTRMEQFGLLKEFRKFKQDVAYYQQQLREYKEILENPEKLERKLLDLVIKIPAFNKFFSANSQLSSLFRLPGSSPPINQMGVPMAGLQIRTSVLQNIQGNMGGALQAQMAVQQGMQSAQSQLNELKNKIGQVLPSGEASDEDFAEIKINSQRAKKLVQRLVFETNLQNNRNTTLLPASSDIGLSLGYRLNDKSVLGIGGAFRMGWGKDIQHIHITGQGLSFRSFLEWKAPFGSSGKSLITGWLITGAYELNYRPSYRGVTINSPSGSGISLDSWQPSGLLGLSRVFTGNSKVLKKIKLQALWDFVSYSQVPRPQPFIFRIHYGFQSK